MKNYDHVIKNKMLPSGKLISDYEIMTGKNISDEEFAYIDEIINKLEELSLTTQDIEFISMEVKENSKQYVVLTWQEFESQYPRLSYDNGLGSQKINPTLTICTKDYIFYRREYDGAEWFEYVPTKQYILDNADAFNDKNIIRADTYYGINNHCCNEGYDYDL